MDGIGAIGGSGGGTVIWAHASGGRYAHVFPMDPLHVTFTLFFVVLTVAAVAVGLYWGVVWFRVRQTARKLPTGMDGVAIAEAGAEPDEAVLVVVPAHNEVGSIGALIRSLREQDHQRFHVVLALDRCTDGTVAVARREIAGDTRFEILEVEHCPEGWAGKVHAVYAGVERTRFLAEADRILFTDADCVLHPACLRATSALARERGLDLLSLLSEYPAEKWYEHFVQPVAGFELMRQYPLLRANRSDDRQRPFANGQFMLFDARFYRAMGGHEPVRAELLEDLALAREVKRRGGRAGAFMGGGVVRCRMYETWDEFRRGWRRIMMEAAQRQSSRLRNIGWRARTLGTILPVTVLVLGIATAGLGLARGGEPGWTVTAAAMTVVSLGVFLLGTGLICRIARVSVLAPLMVPVSSWLVSRILIEAASELESGRPTVWGGKAYHREDRSTARRRAHAEGSAAT
jgi:hypothetical protein